MFLNIFKRFSPSNCFFFLSLPFVVETFIKLKSTLAARAIPLKPLSRRLYIGERNAVAARGWDNYIMLLSEAQCNLHLVTSTCPIYTDMLFPRPLVHCIFRALSLPLFLKENMWEREREKKNG